MGDIDIVVIGGGQAGLTVGYYLRRAGLVPDEDFIILDGADRPGGAWPRMWDGLRTFSPASFSSLPGWMMPPWNDAEFGYPPRTHVVDYLSRYEQRYELRVRRRDRVTSVTRLDDDPRGRLSVSSDAGDFAARAVVSATGTWEQPFWPIYPGAGDYGGRQLHAADYRRPDEFAGQRVIVVGGGNSAAQILAEVSTVADTIWTTTRPPRFLPDDVDGRALFIAARARVQALSEGREHPGVGGLGDIVMVESVRDARDRGVLKAQPMFERLAPAGASWPDGTTQQADAVIWCTGFRPALRHLRGLGLSTEGGRIAVGGPTGTRAKGEPRLFLVGYGDWVGPASATLAGVGPSARATADVVARELAGAWSPAR